MANLHVIFVANIGYPSPAQDPAPFCIFIHTFSHTFYSHCRLSANYATAVTMAPLNNQIPNQKFKVAAVHAAPVFMNKAATTQKVIRLIEQAAKEDIKLLVFPETFIPGYPVRRAQCTANVIVP